MNVNGWTSEQQDFTAPYVDTVDMEAAVAVPDATSALIRLRCFSVMAQHRPTSTRMIT
ncbi:hypothetical protein ACIBI8_19430 [Streptomyces sp. NPDC050529]|uniref:hypothetical protein n=1 Tax=Streptomyces sp. NPDC050529 TaxID=3365624 RepID=UPI003796EBD4